KLSLSSGSAATTTLSIAPVLGQTADIFQVYDTSLGLDSVISASGNWGIGDTNPAEKLSVNGNLLISGNSTTTHSTSTSFFATTGRFTNLCLTGDNCITTWPSYDDTDVQT